MDLRELVTLLKRRWLPIVALTLIGSAVALGLTQREEKLYTAQATILVAPGAGQSTTDLNSGATFVDRVVKTYSSLATTPVVLDPVREKLDLGQQRSLRSSVGAVIDEGTTFVRIKATWTDPKTAARIANEVAAQMKTAVPEFAPRNGAGASIVISTVTPASAPSAPSSPDLVSNIVAGTFAGLLVGLGYVVLSVALDSRVRTSGDLRRITPAPVVGVISPPRRARYRIPDAFPWAEDYRRMRTNLRLSDAAQRPSTLVVASCTSDEGRITVAFGLARTAVEGGLRVCLVEADLRAPRLAKDLGLGVGPGVVEVVRGVAELADARHTVDRVDVIPAGGDVANPGDLVASVQMVDLIHQLSAEYDLVVCDTPPLLSYADAAALGAAAQGVVLVVGRPRVTSDQVARAVADLRMAGADLLGVVLNDAADVAPAPLPARAAGSRTKAPKTRSDDDPATSPSGRSGSGHRRSARDARQDRDEPSEADSEVGPSDFVHTR